MFVLKKNIVLDSIFKKELDVELEIIDFVQIYWAWYICGIDLYVRIKDRRNYFS